MDFHINLFYMGAVMPCRDKFPPYMTTVWIFSTISINKLLIPSFEIFSLALNASFHILLLVKGTPAEAWIWLSRTLIYFEKFMTACLTQSPVPQVIYLLQTFPVLWPRVLQGHLSCGLDKRSFFLQHLLGKLNWRNPTTVVFCLYIQRSACISYCTLKCTVDQQRCC